MTKVKIPKETFWAAHPFGLTKQQFAELPDFIEMYGEVVEEKQPCTHSRYPSGAMYCLRPDGCTYRVEEKCEHPESMRKGMPFGRGAYRGYCGREFPESPIIEELKDDFDTTSQVIKITDKLNELIRAVNLLRK